MQSTVAGLTQKRRRLMLSTPPEAARELGQRSSVRRIPRPSRGRPSPAPAQGGPSSLSAGARLRARRRRRGGTSRPLTPSSTSSGMPESLLATTGRPGAHRLHEHDRNSLTLTAPCRDARRDETCAESRALRSRLGLATDDRHPSVEPAFGDPAAQRSPVGPVLRPACRQDRPASVEAARQASIR